MKVFIAVDLEGVAGYVKWDPADRQREREFITADANAAIQGAFEGGATEVLVTEAHANMRNIIPEQLDGRASFLSGKPKSQNHMAGIDDTFDAAMLVGYHARAGILNAVMAHTYSLSIFSLVFNGIEVGELGADAAIAGYYGVPVVMTSGDTALCAEAQELLGDIETVCVKEGVSHTAAKRLGLERARELIADGARRGLDNAGACPPFAIHGPVQTEITFSDPSYADNITDLPLVERVDGRTVRFTTDDYLQAFETFNPLHYLAGFPHS